MPLYEIRTDTSRTPFLTSYLAFNLPLYVSGPISAKPNFDGLRDLPWNYLLVILPAVSHPDKR